MRIGVAEQEGGAAEAEEDEDCSSDVNGEGLEYAAEGKCGKGIAEAREGGGWLIQERMK